MTKKEKLERFRAAYHEGLQRGIKEHPELYVLCPKEGQTKEQLIAERAQLMCNEIARAPYRVIYIRETPAIYLAECPSQLEGQSSHRCPRCKQDPQYTQRTDTSPSTMACACHSNRGMGKVDAQGAWDRHLALLASHSTPLRHTQRLRSELSPSCLTCPKCKSDTIAVVGLNMFFELYCPCCPVHVQGATPSELEANWVKAASDLVPVQEAPIAVVCFKCSTNCEGRKMFKLWDKTTVCGDCAAEGVPLEQQHLPAVKFMAPYVEYRRKTTSRRR